MSNDQYSAPVTSERQENLKQRTEEMRDRFARFFNHPLDSIELSGLAEELEGLAGHFRAVRNRSVDEHQDQTVRKYRVLARSVTEYETIIHCKDCDKRQDARATDGGDFDQIGEGSWTIVSVEAVSNDVDWRDIERDPEIQKIQEE